MRWQKGQYLLFAKSVGKITKIVNGRAHIRKFTRGNTKHGYSWQNNMHVVKLDVYHKKDAVRIISPEEVLQMIYYNFEGCMPIGNVNET